METDHLTPDYQAFKAFVYNSLQKLKEEGHEERLDNQMLWGVFKTDAEMTPEDYGCPDPQHVIKGILDEYCNYLEDLL